MAAKQAYFKRQYEAAPMVDCACGCGTRIKSKDKYARPALYVNGHNGRKYKDPTQHKREWNHRNRAARQQAKAAYHRTRKQKLLQVAGNKCQECGIAYNGKNAAIFHFHHLKDKSFNIGNNVINYSWKKLLNELSKCQLLCANCHEMKHSGEF